MGRGLSAQQREIVLAAYRAGDGKKPMWWQSFYEKDELLEEVYQARNRFREMMEGYHFKYRRSIWMDKGCKLIGGRPHDHECMEFFFLKESGYINARLKWDVSSESLLCNVVFMSQSREEDGGRKSEYGLITTEGELELYSFEQYGTKEESQAWTARVNDDIEIVLKEKPYLRKHLDNIRPSSLLIPCQGILMADVAKLIANGRAVTDSVLASTSRAVASLVERGLGERRNGHNKYGDQLRWFILTDKGVELARSLIDG